MPRENVLFMVAAPFSRGDNERESGGKQLSIFNINYGNESHRKGHEGDSDCALSFFQCVVISSDQFACIGGLSAVYDKKKGGEWSQVYGGRS